MLAEWPAAVEAPAWAPSTVSMGVSQTTSKQFRGICWRQLPLLLCLIHLYCRVHLTFDHFIFYFGLFLHVIPNYIHSTSNDIHTDGARAKTGGYKGIRGDRRFKGRGGYPMETSYHFIHQNIY